LVEGNGGMSGKSIAVVGGGIGGVSAALNLLRAGFDVHVYEQSRALREVGAGINVTPNATRVIYRLGLGDKLAGLGVMPIAVHQQRWDDGRTLLRTPLGTEIERYFGFPQYQSHRADVLNMLVGALPPDRMHLGHRLTGFSERADKIEAQFENGVRATADALIGATASTRWCSASYSVPGGCSVR
jgi:2-polyprenyl-6-methoxyphenol hydroxylase-like FAD-dependent oxidoreductase